MQLKGRKKNSKINLQIKLTPETVEVEIGGKQDSKTAFPPLIKITNLLTIQLKKLMNSMSSSSLRPYWMTPTTQNQI